MKDSLMFNSRLKYLNLSKNRLTCESAIILCEILKSNDSLVALFLHWNFIRNRGCCALARALEVNDRLKILDISHN